MSDISLYIVNKIKYRKLHELMMRCKTEQETNELINKIKTNNGSDELDFPVSDQAIEIFLHAWRNQVAGRIGGGQSFPSTRKIVEIRIEKIIEDDEEIEERKYSLHDQVRNLSLAPDSIQYTFEMCELLAVSILMLIKLYEYDEIKYIFDPLRDTVQSISKSASERNSNSSPKRMYNYLLSLQLKLNFVISREKKT